MTTFPNPSHVSSGTLLPLRGARRRNPPWSRCGPGISVMVMGLLGGAGCSSMMLSEGPTKKIVDTDILYGSENSENAKVGEAEEVVSSILAYSPSLYPLGLRLRECEDGSVIFEYDFVMKAERDPRVDAMQDDSFYDVGYPVFAMPEAEVFFGPPPPAPAEIGVSVSPGFSEEIIPGLGDAGLWRRSGNEGGTWIESGATPMTSTDPPTVGRGFELFMKTFAASCLFAVILIPSGCAYGAQRIAPCSRGSPQ